MGNTVWNAETIVRKQVEANRDRAIGIRKYIRALCREGGKSPKYEDYERHASIAFLARMCTRLSGFEVTNDEVALAAMDVFPHCRPIKMNRKHKSRERVLVGIVVRGGIHTVAKKLTHELAKLSWCGDERKLVEYLAETDWKQYPYGHEAVFKLWVYERGSVVKISSDLGFDNEFCARAISEHRARAGISIK
jgi:hypothetical protein